MKALETVNRIPSILFTSKMFAIGFMINGETNCDILLAIPSIATDVTISSGFTFAYSMEYRDGDTKLVPIPKHVLPNSNTVRFGENVTSINALATITKPIGKVYPFVFEYILPKNKPIKKPITELMTVNKLTNCESPMP